MHANADSLSHLPVQEDEDQDAAATAMFKISLIGELPLAATDIAAETNKDDVLSQVYRFVLEGWPQRGVDDSLKPFYQRKDQLTMDQGCLLWGTRVIILLSLQARLLQELHYTHPDMVKMKLLARSYMWWPRVDSNIEEVAMNVQPNVAYHPWHPCIVGRGPTNL